MPKYTVIFVGRHGDTELHRHGCKDAVRAIRHTDTSHRHLDADNLGVAVDMTVAGLNASFGWTADSGEDPPWHPEAIRILPCVHS
jgi:hypothetical protein